MEQEIINIIYTIVDIETTGGKFNEEKITEIAIFKIQNDGKVIKFHKLINPKKKIQPFVEKLTGINNQMLKNEPTFIEIANEINEFTNDSIFVAHNVNFDFRVLSKEFSRIGLNFKRKLLCTIEVSKKVFPNENSYSLGKLVKSLGIGISNRHRADGDAEATLHLFNKLRSNLNTEELNKFIRKI